jgi:hypothetical protein
MDLVAAMSYQADRLDELTTIPECAVFLAKKPKHYEALKQLVLERAPRHLLPVILKLIDETNRDPQSLGKRSVRESIASGARLFNSAPFACGSEYGASGMRFEDLKAQWNTLPLGS